MPGKEEVTITRLEEEIAKILDGADLKTTSTKKVRLELEKTFADLKPWAKKIDQIVMDHVEKMDEEESIRMSSDEESSSEEEKPKTRGAKKEPEDEDDDDESEEEKPKKRAPTKKKASEPEDDDDDSEEEVKKKKPAAKKPNTRKRRGSADDNDYKPKKSKAKKAPGAGGGGGKSNGYTKAYKLSPALSTLMGEVEMPRHEVVRRVWAMIKEKNLYDPNNKQFAICDEALYTVIGVKKFRTFGMMKYLKNHFIT